MVALGEGRLCEEQCQYTTIQFMAFELVDILEGAGRGGEEGGLISLAGYESWQ